MNAQSFLGNFGHLANAPNGVEKLRELLLCLAMQGRLGEQSNEDTPVETLLEAVENEKLKLIQEKVIRRVPKTLPISQQEIRHEIPIGWKWVRFGDIAYHNAGKTLDKRRNTGEPRDYITTSNVYWGFFELGELRQMLIRDEELERCTARKGDLLICEGGEAGRAAVWASEQEVSFQNHIHRARFFAGIDAYFVYHYLQKLNATGEINEYRKGVGISNMSGKSLASIVLPLPPIEEQKRIVDKVDELMALCDKLEAQQQERENLFPVLSRATHTRLVESPSPQNLKAIFNKKDFVSCGDVRETIMNFALKGEIVRQNTEDEPASNLLRRIELEKEALIDLEILKPERQKVTMDVEEPFGLPENWIWVELRQVFLVITDGDHQAPPKSAVGVPFIVIGNVRTGEVNFSDTRRVTTEYFNSLDPIKKPTKGDILYTLVGSYGIPILLKDSREFCVQRHIGILKPSQHVSEKYLTKVLSSSFVFQQAASCATGIAQKTVPLKGLRSIKIPLPPIEEQYRIVTRLEKLMALVDQLEQQQAKKSKVAAIYAQAIVTEITGSKTGESEPMKAPKTELVTKLEIGKKPRKSDQAPLASLIAKAKGGVTAKDLWQQSDLEIDAFYQQLRTEMASKWIVEPEPAVMKQVEAG